MVPTLVENSNFFCVPVNLSEGIKVAPPPSNYQKVKINAQCVTIDIFIQHGNIA